MSRLVRVLVLLVLVAVGLPARSPATAAPEMLLGGPVTLIGHLPQNGAVSGRIIEQPDPAGGTDRFLVTHTPKGIDVYDLAIPEAPVVAGHLPLPHFYTEDMDFGGDVLLVALDPGWTFLAGGLYVVDISNLPQLGLHYVNPLTANRWTAPVSATSGGGHTISCIRADCSWAYVNGSDRIGVLDLRTPSNPQVAAVFPSGIGDTHDIQVDDAGIAWMVGSAGIVALDTTVPTAPVRISNVHGGGLGYHHNSLRPGAGDTVLITEEVAYPVLEQTACDGQGQFQTRHLSDPDGLGTGTKASLSVLDTWETELQVAGIAAPSAGFCSAHYFSEDDGLVAIAWYDQGTRLLDVSDPADIRQVGYSIVPGGEPWDTLWIGPGALGGEILYVFDFNRGIDILRVDRDAPLLPVEAPILDEWRSPEAARAADLPAMTAQPDPRFGFLCRIPGAATPAPATA